MSDEIAEMKRASLAERREKRDQSNSSVIDSMGLTPEDSGTLEIRDTEETEITLKSKPAVCKNCYGKGKYKPMFYEIECPDCFGTGYSLDDPIALIKWQKLCIEWSKTELKRRSTILRELVTTQEERTEAAMQKMYANSGYNKHE